jgi:hypothetical protein
MAEIPIVAFSMGYTLFQWFNGYGIYFRSVVAAIMVKTDYGSLIAIATGYEGQLSVLSR